MLMKKYLLGLLLLSVCSYAQAQSKNYLDVPYIEVVGNADTILTPDQIFIRINIAEADTRGRQSVEDL